MTPLCNTAGGGMSSVSAQQIWDPVGFNFVPPGAGAGDRSGREYPVDDPFPGAGSVDPQTLAMLSQSCWLATNRGELQELPKPFTYRGPTIMGAHGVPAYVDGDVVVSVEPDPIVAGAGCITNGERKRLETAGKLQPAGTIGTTGIPTWAPWVAGGALVVGLLYIAVR
jgi:hypothetical protein